MCKFPFSIIYWNLSCEQLSSKSWGSRHDLSSLLAKRPKRANKIEILRACSAIIISEMSVGEACSCNKSSCFDVWPYRSVVRGGNGKRGTQAEKYECNPFTRARIHSTEMDYKVGPRLREISAWPCLPVHLLVHLCILFVARRRTESSREYEIW